jgi:hypothetical protein
MLTWGGSLWRSSRRLAFRWAPVVRQQFVDARGRLALHAQHDVGQVIDWVNAVLGTNQGEYEPAAARPGTTTSRRRLPNYGETLHAGPIEAGPVGALQGAEGASR